MWQHFGPDFGRRHRRQYCYSFTGTQVLTLTTVANGSYAPDAGTSEVAPMVSGAAALLRAERPDLSAAQIRAMQIRAILVASARSVAGGHLLDVGAAVTLARTVAAAVARTYTLSVKAQQSGHTVRTFASSGTLTVGQNGLPFTLSGVGLQAQ